MLNLKSIFLLSILVAISIDLSAQSFENKASVLDSALEKSIINNLNSLVYRGRFYGMAAKQEYEHTVRDLYMLSENFKPSSTLTTLAARLLVLKGGEGKYEWLSIMLKHNLLVQENFFMFVNSLEKRYERLDRLMKDHQEALFKLADSINFNDATKLIPKLRKMSKKNPIMYMWIFKIGYKFKLISSNDIKEILKFFAFDIGGRLSELKLTADCMTAFEKSKTNGIYREVIEELITLAMEKNEQTEIALKNLRRELDPFKERQSKLDMQFVHRLMAAEYPLLFEAPARQMSCRDLFK